MTSVDLDIPRKRRNPSIPGGGKRKNRDAHKTARREGADRRAAERDARGDTAQLDRLFANGHGHCAEARRLAEGAA